MNTWRRCRASIPARCCREETMSAERGALMLYELPADRVTLEVLAERTGVHSQRILHYVDHGLLEPCEHLGNGRILRPPRCCACGGSSACGGISASIWPASRSSRELDLNAGRLDATLRRLGEEIGVRFWPPFSFRFDVD
jgi:hypothetical protein